MNQWKLHKDNIISSQVYKFIKILLKKVLLSCKLVTNGVTNRVNFQPQHFESLKIIDSLESLQS
jgi:hypothetical protein